MSKNPSLRSGKALVLMGRTYLLLKIKTPLRDHTEENSEISEKEPASQFDWLLKFVGEELGVEMSFDELELITSSEDEDSQVGAFPHLKRSTPSDSAHLKHWNLIWGISLLVSGIRTIEEIFPTFPLSVKPVEKRLLR